MPKEKLIGIEEAAEELNVSSATIYNLIARGILRKVKYPTGKTRVFVSADDVQRAKEPIEE